MEFLAKVKRLGSSVFYTPCAQGIVRQWRAGSSNEKTGLDEPLKTRKTRKGSGEINRKVRRGTQRGIARDSSCWGIGPEFVEGVENGPAFGLVFSVILDVQ